MESMSKDRSTKKGSFDQLSEAKEGQSYAFFVRKIGRYSLRGLGNSNANWKTQTY